MLKKVEQYFWVFFLIAIVIGVFFPSVGIIFEPYILYLMLSILFLSSLKIDIIDVISHLKKPFFLAYITSMLLIFVPLLLFFITKLIYPELALPVLVLTAMPAGMATPVLTDIMKGKISLALVIAIITSLLCPFTIPFLMKYLVGTKLTVSASAMTMMLGKIIFLPFIAASIARKFAKKFIEKTKQYYSSISILLIMLLTMGPLARHSSYFLNNIEKILGITLYMFLVSALLHIIGWLMVNWKTKKEKTAVANAYVNNSLAIVFAAKFFGPLVVLSVILYELPWDLMLIPFRYILKRL